MSLKSVYLPDAAIDGNLVSISGDEHRHLNVARAAAGEMIEIFDGKGNVWSAVIREVGRRETSVLVTGSRVVEPEPHPIVLGLALIRLAAFELALEKAIEVGVSRIIPFSASRSNVTPADRAGRWQRIIVEAAKQSKRYRLPIIDEPVSFQQVLAVPAASRIVFAEHGGGPLKPALIGSPVLYLIGPEGGWTDVELDAASQKGFALVSLGAGILKAETAAIVGAALIRYELGAW